MDVVMQPPRRRAGATATLDRLISSPANYHASLFVDAGGAVIFLLAGLQAPLTAGVRVAAVVAGFTAWGFVEYAVHRWLGHGAGSIGRRGHAMHHADDAALVAAPVFVVMAGVFTIWAALALVTGAGIAALIVFGLYAGYNQYALVHHVLHHHAALAARLGFRRMQHVHQVHHVRHDVNFGVTSTLWDRIFRTYQPASFSKTTRS
jgi:sterol desaturase/sphingolipid hydroxylase (fatty acid hydroxylase superfamily)